jgi:hypothetical protein
MYPPESLGGWRLAEVRGSACFLLEKLALPPNTIGGRNDEKQLITRNLYRISEHSA